MTPTRPNHRLILLLVGVLALAKPLAASPLSPPTPAGRDETLWTLMSDYLEALHARSPESVGPMFDDDRLADRLGDVSPDAHHRWDEALMGFRARASMLDPGGWSDADRLDAELLVHALDRQLEAVPHRLWQMPVATQSGPQVWLPQLADQLPMRDDTDRARYLARLRQVPVVVGDTIDTMRAGIAEGHVPPRVIVEPTVAQALAQCTPAIVAEPSASPFYEPFRTLPHEHPLARDARAVIADRIVPVYRELALFISNEYLPACRDAIGLSQANHGAAAYEALLREHTTLDAVTAEKIHAIGLGEVARIRAEMLGVIRRTDWYQGLVGRVDPTPAWATGDDDRLFAEFIAYLRTDPRFVYERPGDLLDAYRVIAKNIDPELPRLFGRLPRLPYGVRAMPPHAAEHAPTAYYLPGSIPAANPGVFLANTSKLDQRPRYEMIALTLHEAVPGHHLQVALAQELEDQHPLRSTYGFTAFVEGWALYAESLGLEMAPGIEGGLYADPYDDFGRLNFEMWRALRLVVDTGIHAQGWQRDRAIAYMAAHSALAPHNIASEVDRYIGWPGQATGYKVGELRIRAIRDKAEARLGDRFDLRAFHDALLEAGAVPLPVLERRMDRWIDDRM